MQVECLLDEDITSCETVWSYLISVYHTFFWFRCQILHSIFTIKKPNTGFVLICTSLVGTSKFIHILLHLTNSFPGRKSQALVSDCDIRLDHSGCLCKSHCCLASPANLESFTRRTAAPDVFSVSTYPGCFRLRKLCHRVNGDYFGLCHFKG